MDRQQRYQKFQQSRQEPLRLSIALEEFFQDEDPVRRAAYEQYLRRRLQPAVQRLVESDDTLGLSRLAPWFTAGQTDAFIALAREKRKTAALVWLLRWKGEHYGFPDKDFSL